VLRHWKTSSRDYMPVAASEDAAATAASAGGQRGGNPRKFRTDIQTRKSMPGGCRCLWCCMVLFSVELLVSMMWLLVVSPLTLRYTRQAAGWDAESCEAQTSWSASQQDWCCKSFYQGCKASYVSLGRYIAMQSGAFTIMVALPLFACACGRLFDTPVRRCVEAIERDILGVPVELAGLSVEACCGVIRLEGLVVGNPEGFRAPHLLRAGRVVIDVDMAKYFCSCGRNITIQKLVLSDVEVINEIKGTTTNALTLAHSLGIDLTLERQLAKAASLKSLLSKGKASDGGRSVTLHEVYIHDITLRTQLDALAGLGPRAHIGDHHWRDFSEETRAHSPTAVIHELMRQLLSNELSNEALTLIRTSFHGMAEAAQSAEHRAHAALTSLTGGQL